MYRARAGQKMPMYRARAGRGLSQRTWSRSGRRVCWRPFSRIMRACCSLPPGPRGRRECWCCLPRVAMSSRSRCVRCRSGERRVPARGCVREGAKRRVVSAGAGFSLTGTGASGGGGIAVAGCSGAVAHGATAAGRDARCALLGGDVGWPVRRPASLSLVEWCCVWLRRARVGRPAASPGLARQRPKA